VGAFSREFAVRRHDHSTDERVRTRVPFAFVRQA
jgi:hypothetical protein